MHPGRPGLEGPAPHPTQIGISETQKIHTMAQIRIGKKTFLIPEEGSPCDLWKSYYDQLRKEVGKDNAKTIWLITWGQNGSTSCTTNSDFNKWLKKHDMDVSNASTRAIADLSSIGGNILGFGKNMTKILSIGTPILLGGAALVILVLLINTARKGDVSDLAALHPAGRAAKLSGGLKLLNG